MGDGLVEKDLQFRGKGFGYFIWECISDWGSDLGEDQMRDEWFWRGGGAINETGK